MIRAGHIVYRDSIPKSANIEYDGNPSEHVEAMTLTNQLFEEDQEAELNGRNSAPCKHEPNSDPLVESIRLL